MKVLKDCSYYYDCCSCGGGDNDCGCRYCYDCNKCEVCEALDKDVMTEPIDYVNCEHIKHSDRW